MKTFFPCRCRPRRSTYSAPKRFTDDFPEKVCCQDSSKASRWRLVILRSVPKYRTAAHFCTLNGTFSFSTLRRLLANSRFCCRLLPILLPPLPICLFCGFVQSYLYSWRPYRARMFFGRKNAIRATVPSGRRRRALVSGVGREKILTSCCCGDVIRALDETRSPARDAPLASTGW